MLFLNIYVGRTYSYLYNISIYFPVRVETILNSTKTLGEIILKSSAHRYWGHCLLTVIVFLTVLAVSETETWKGLEVRAEYTDEECPSYSSLRDDYQYSTNTDLVLQQLLGGYYSPYDQEWYDEASEVDVEHIVARKEAHDSGLCLAKVEDRYQFANDLLNLTLSTPSVNRNEKRDKDAAEWLPENHKCWFVYTVIRVKQKYNLSVDEKERDALQEVLESEDCQADDIFLEPVIIDETPTPVPSE